MTYFCPRCLAADIKFLGSNVFAKQIKSYICNACKQQFTTFDDGKELHEAFVTATER